MLNGYGAIVYHIITFSSRARHARHLGRSPLICQPLVALALRRLRLVYTFRVSQCIDIQIPVWTSRNLTRQRSRVRKSVQSSSRVLIFVVLAACDAGNYGERHGRNGQPGEPIRAREKRWSEERIERKRCLLEFLVLGCLDH